MVEPKENKSVSQKKLVKKKMKQIKQAKQRGNDKRAQRLGDELFIMLGWE